MLMIKNRSVNRSRRCAAPSLCTPNCIMNGIAAHKDALERSLVKLSGNTAVARIGFLALLDAYITRLDTNCSDIKGRVNPSPAQTNGELTWNQH